ncbi:hypothetical protein [Ensifer aridi]|uniref:hypothetical protein n=1 Tax=Ensifer aridi TaxID=1708715 RepID=UPI00111BDD60|nr:hypothetical protein [Ensifer aridi]
MNVGGMQEAIGQLDTSSIDLSSYGNNRVGAIANSRFVLFSTPLSGGFLRFRRSVDRVIGSAGAKADKKPATWQIVTIGNQRRGKNRLSNGVLGCFRRSL